MQQTNHYGAPTRGVPTAQHMVHPAHAAPRAVVAVPAPGRTIVGGPVQGGFDGFSPSEPIAELGSRSPDKSLYQLGGAAGFDGGLGDVDVTVMAYAQWLSEMKQSAKNAQYQQQAELDLMRDAVNANNNELIDFKRHSSTIQQQLQGQVTELREQMSEAVKEISSIQRQRNDIEIRVTTEINSIRDELNVRQAEMDAIRRSQGEQMSQLHSTVMQAESKLKQSESDMGSMKKAFASMQEQTIGKFSEVDKAMSLFHGSVNNVRSELQDTKQDWKKGQDLLGQAISTLSQDLADFQKHMNTVMNKLQSDVYKLEEQDRSSKDRMNRVESQVGGMQQNLYSTANDVILMKSGQGGDPSRTKENSPRPLNRRASLSPDPGPPQRMDSASSRLPRAQHLQVQVSNVSGPPSGRQGLQTSLSQPAIVVDNTYQQRSPTPTGRFAGGFN